MKKTYEVLLDVEDDILIVEWTCKHGHYESYGCADLPLAVLPYLLEALREERLLPEHFLPTYE